MLKEISNLQFGEFTLDRHSREVRKQGTVLPVSGKAFDLLSYMATNAGRPLPKSELLDAVWPETSVEESNLSQNVFLLRKVLGAGSDGPIKTLPGRGYQFAAQVTEIESTTASREYALPTDTRTASIRLETTHTRMIVEDEVEEHFVSPRAAFLIAGIAVAILLASSLFVFRHSLDKVGAPVTASAGAASPTGRRAVAVVGFRNISNRPEDSWLSTAFAEMLANEMSAGDKLRVIPNDEVARAQSDLVMKTGALDSEATRANLRRATGADMLVEGSFVVVDHGSDQRAGEAGPALRLMIQVQDAHSGKPMASFSETGEVGGLFKLVDQAGTELRKDLSDNGLGDGKQPQAGMSQNSEAMRYYAEGVDQSRHFDYHSAQSLFERAVVADSTFAMAHLGLADAWAGLGFMERAASEAAKAYQLSPDLPKEQRLAIEADYRHLSKDDDRAINLYKALATFYPDDKTWSLRLATVQMNSGQEQEAVNTLEGLRKLSLVPFEIVDVDGIESEFYGNLDDAKAKEKARALLADGVSIADKQGGLLLHSRATQYKCTVLSHIGPVPEGREACEQSKTAAEAVGNLLVVANAVNNLGVLSQQAGNWEEAEAEYADAGRQYHRVGDFEYEVDEILNLGHLALSHGDLEKAIRESIKLSHVTGTSDDYHTAYEGHRYAAFALMQSGRLQEARVEAQEAQHDADMQHSRDYKVYQQARSRDLRGWIEFKAGNFDEALNLFEEARILVRPTHDATADALFSVDQATVVLEQGHADNASLDVVRHAISVISNIQEESDSAIEDQVLLAQMDIQTGGLAEAVKAIAQAKTLDARGDSLDTHLYVLLGDAALQEALGHTNEAKKDLQDEVNTAQARGFAYLALDGEIASARLTQKATPSAANLGHLHSLKQQAERAGFKGLARQAIPPRA